MRTRTSTHTYICIYKAPVEKMLLLQLQQQQGYLTGQVLMCLILDQGCFWHMPPSRSAHFFQELYHSLLQELWSHPPPTKNEIYCSSSNQKIKDNLHKPQHHDFVNLNKRSRERNGSNLLLISFIKKKKKILPS